MKKIFVLAAITLCLGFVACEESEVIKVIEQKPEALIVNKSEDNTVAQIDTLYLSAKVDNLPGTMEYLWTIDGKEVSRLQSYKFSELKTGEYSIGLTVTGMNGDKLQSELKAKVYGRFSKGTFVLNEGNMSNETGTLTFIDSKGVLLDSAYYRVNGTLLGNVCQDLFIANNKIYILSQNGAKNGGEGLLTIAQADNLEKEKVCNSTTLSWPTNIAVVGENIYIRDNKGVYLFNASTEALTFVENSKGAKKIRMAVVGDKVFAMTSKSILVIKDGIIVHTISAPGALSGIAKSYDGNLWVSCTSPAQILKINPTDYTIDTHELTDVKIGAGLGVAPAFSAVKDTLYFSNAGFDLYRHIFKENKTEFVAKVNESLPDAKMYYNSLGVDPESGEVYFATIKGYGMDYKINDIAIFDFSKKPALKHDYKQKNSFPAGVFFTSYF